MLECMVTAHCMSWSMHVYASMARLPAGGQGLSGIAT